MIEALTANWLLTTKQSLYKNFQTGPTEKKNIDVKQYLSLRVQSPT